MHALEELLSAPGRQAASLDVCEHRPWTFPDRPWLMGQSWEDLLFAHWRVPPAALDPHVPAGLVLERFDDSAWLGMTPFRLSGLRLRGTPPVPLVSRFLETNVRTYVRRAGKPGILFFSLDAASAGAVVAARLAYRLPYFPARMRRRRGPDGTIDYGVRRLARRPAALRLRYAPAGETFTAAPGSLEHFLAERYCLYAADRSGRLFRAEIHHSPWPLQPARAEIEENTLPPPALGTLAGEPLLHFARRQDVLIWSLEPAEP